MADTNKILKSLQHHAEAPPPGLYAKLWQKIKPLAARNKALLHKILSDTDEKTVLAEDEKLFSSLQSYTDKETTPPPFDFEKIKAALASNPKPVAVKKHTTRFWIYRIAAAAAVTGIIFLVYVKTSGNKEQPVNNNSNQPATTLIIKQDVAAKDTSIALKKQVPALNTYNDKITGKLQYSKAPFAGITTATTSPTILNNDFLYTLTNFKAGEANSFFAGLQKDKKISQDNYSYVNVSDKMAAFLKQLYAVNRRKKPTWKARRMKAKLNKWKKADQKNFDSNANKDPLDILDLSQFLLNNKP